jgi:hypothetical protein
VHTEAGATTGLILGPNPAAVRLSDVAHNRQSQARAAMRATSGAVHAIETVEHALERLGRQSRPIVRDNQACLGRPALQRHVNRVRRCRSIAQRVLQQVRHQLAQPVLISGDDHRLGIHVHARDAVTADANDDRLNHQVEAHGVPFAAAWLADLG